MPESISLRYHKLLSALLMAVVAAGVFVSFLLDWQQTEQTMQSVARERGAALFRLVELTRSWNARHGGVYVPVTQATQPNPYLDHKKRDLVTTDGTALTMVNPAFMTRQIAEIAEKSQRRSHTYHQQQSDSASQQARGLGGSGAGSI
jgi:hypothetical protein